MELGVFGKLDSVYSTLDSYRVVSSVFVFFFILDLSLKILFQEQISKNSSKATALVHILPITAFTFE